MNYSYNCTSSEHNINCSNNIAFLNCSVSWINGYNFNGTCNYKNKSENSIEIKNSNLQCLCNVPYYGMCDVLCNCDLYYSNNKNYVQLCTINKHNNMARGVVLCSLGAIILIIIIILVFRISKCNKSSNINSPEYDKLI